MPDQNKVAFNISQSKTDAEKQQARENIGVEHNVKFISNTSSPVPTLTQVQAMLDAGDYVVLMYDDGNSATPAVPMTVIQDFRGGTPFVMFCEVNGSGAITVSLTGSGFGAPTIDLFAEGKLQEFAIPNGTSSATGLYVGIVTVIGIGKIPLIKYEETTSPLQYGYYWLMSKGSQTLNFVRVVGDSVKILAVDSTDQITINSYPFDKFDMENLAPQWTSVTFKGDALVTDEGHMYRASQNSTPIDTPNGSPNVWTKVDVASLLGRVRDASEEAVVDPNNATKWEIPNNALCVINTAAAGPLSIEIDIKVWDAEVANAAVNIKSAEGGTVTVKTHRYRAISPNDPPTVATCYYSKSAGNEIPSNKDVQITCVGNRWTWEEYVDPDALNNAKGSNGANEKEEPLIPLEAPPEVKK